MASRGSPNGVLAAPGVTPCQRCGSQMRLINSPRSRLLLFWCPDCDSFAERREQ
jgi:hypothetical protein